jgi:hypothetical protein
MIQVYLVERLDADRGDQLLHMKVCLKPMQRPATQCRLTHSLTWAKTAAHLPHG